MMLSGRSSDHEASTHHFLFNLFHRRDAFHLIHQDIHSLLANHIAALFHRGQHRLTGNGTLHE